MSRPAPLAALLVLLGCAHGASQDAQDLALSGQALFVGPLLATGLAAGSDVADGPHLLWLADEHRVYTLAADGTTAEVWKAPRFSRILRFEAADVDADGVDEWVVLLDQGRVRSLLVDRVGDTREAVGRPFNGYLRPLVDSEGAVHLVGQRAGGDSPFRGHIQHVALDERGRLQPGDSLGLPGDLPIYDFFWLPGPGDEPARLFSLEEAGRLAERDPRSPRATTWRSDERIAGRPMEISRSYRNLLGDEEETVLRLPPPVSLTDVDADGDLEVLLVGGVHNPVAVLQNLRVWQGGDSRLFEPGPRGLVELRRSPLLGRAMIAVTPWRVTADQTVWAAAVWTRAGGGLSRAESRVFLFDPSTGDLVGSQR